MHVEGHRQYNPGWHLAIDLRNMLLVSECVAKAALERTESRGGHTRDDHPAMDPNWRKALLVCQRRGGDTTRCPTSRRRHEDQIPMRPDLLEAVRDLRAGEVLHRRRTGRPPRTERLNGATTRACGCGAATRTAASCRTTPSRSTRARWCSTSSTACRPTQTPDLAVRWNCKAGKCGSCSAEVNGKPRLMCMTRMSTFAEDEVVTVTPMRTFPVIRDLVTDVSFNYEKAREIPSFAPPKDLQPGEYRMRRRTWSARRSSASASSASCARTSATWSVTTRRTRRRSPARVS